ncbi:hypothetical protein M23134_02879 [Microscilla marina ATCC 23134]|uniref:Uncharacterized protein n=1 Tax=Microscilla marina ATCC 23134 TaxID=313606 RepID=A1ZPX7_MICM2|nr:hypothetical protein M23134_02879 [Microscilla marina ATCC 23134]
MVQQKQCSFMHTLIIYEPEPAQCLTFTKFCWQLSMVIKLKKLIKCQTF